MIKWHKKTPYVIRYPQPCVRHNLWPMRLACLLYSLQLYETIDANATSQPALPSGGVGLIR